MKPKVRRIFQYTLGDYGWMPADLVWCPDTDRNVQTYTMVQNLPNGTAQGYVACEYQCRKDCYLYDKKFRELEKCQ